MMLRNFHPKSKLSARYRGLFEVRKLDYPNYILDCDGKEKKIHASHLKRFLGR